MPSAFVAQGIKAARRKMDQAWESNLARNQGQFRQAKPLLHQPVVVPQIMVLGPLSSTPYLQETANPLRLGLLCSSRRSPSRKPWVPLRFSSCKGITDNRSIFQVNRDFLRNTEPAFSFSERHAVYLKQGVSFGDEIPASSSSSSHLPIPNKPLKPILKTRV
ncbi:hypothetical protein B7494_g2746 [Chlorociboria aeruginascens]|nr:hypothetical protein B7494_g2746 [Chlorociboria aeruginascens]